MHSIRYQLSEGGSTALRDQDLGVLIRGRLEKHFSVLREACAGERRSAVLQRIQKQHSAFTASLVALREGKLKDLDKIPRNTSIRPSKI